jgi:tetratricopeptide (TPR) repeat protein
MIYQSIYGDLEKAEQAADKLRIVAHGERDQRICARALINVGMAYRVVGRMGDAEAVLLEVLDLSLSNGFLARASAAYLNLTRVYLAVGDVPRARAAMRKHEELSANDQDAFHEADQLFCWVRLALEEGKTEEASEKYAALANHLGRKCSINWRVGVLALGVRIAIQRTASVETVRPVVLELKAVHLQNRSFGMQDLETYALALGLRYCGESEEGLGLLVEYSRYRREKLALPKYLIDLQRELRESHAVSTTRRTGSLSISV